MIKFKASWLLAFVMLFAFSCQKEIKTGSQNAATQNNSVACGTPLVKTATNAKPLDLFQREANFCQKGCAGTSLVTYRRFPATVYLSGWKEAKEW